MQHHIDRRRTPTDRLPVRRHRFRRLQGAELRPKRGTVNWTAIATSAPSVITALTAIGALIFTGLSLKATRNQIAIAEQGQITDRYSRTIEQLGQQGSDKLHIRLGAIYALERIARDSPRDQSTIIEVLSTFIRTTVPTSRHPRLCPNYGSFAPLEPDVQAALTVIGRRDPTRDNGMRVSLKGACLSNADLSSANLQNADLQGVNLYAAKLRGANLARADLIGASLEFAQVLYADLSGAQLGHAYLNTGSFVGSDFSGANLAMAECREAFLGANLTKANLWNADLQGADLSGAILHKADLSHVVHDEKTRVEGARNDDTTIGAWW